MAEFLTEFEIEKVEVELSILQFFSNNYPSHHAVFHFLAR
jgi:hypothetical protein